MPLPSTISDLSTTPSLNSPAGSESPALVDDYLRTHAAFIKQVNDASVKTTGDQTVAGIKNFTGNVVLGGTAQRITGDFSNATVANRVMFQTSTVNGNTNIHAITNGTGSVSSVQANNSSDPANASQIYIAAGASLTQLASDKTGTGTFLPMTFYTGGSERMRIDTSGNVGVGTGSPSKKLQVAATTNQLSLTTGTNELIARASSTEAALYTFQAIPLNFYTNDIERMRIDASGNVILSNELALSRPGTGTVYATFNNGTVNTLVGTSGGGAGAVSLFGNTTNHIVTFFQNNTERFRLDTGGNTLHVTATGGLGYGTGAGGTVTQTTSKGTAVTLNRPTGIITMNNAALGAATTVAFTFNNSLLTTTDMLVLNHLTGGGPENYLIWAGNGSSGARVIYVRNISGGSLSDAIQINFAIIKGATS